MWVSSCLCGIVPSLISWLLLAPAPWQIFVVGIIILDLVSDASNYVCMASCYATYLILAPCGSMDPYWVLLWLSILSGQSNLLISPHSIVCFVIITTASWQAPQLLWRSIEDVGKQGASRETCISGFLSSWKPDASKLTLWWQYPWKVPFYLEPKVGNGQEFLALSTCLDQGKLEAILMASLASLSPTLSFPFHVD